MTRSARDWLDLIRALPLTEPVRIMNVCGGHERSITTAGLRGVLPRNIELIPGPGCPVCVCPEEAIYAAIQHGLREEAIVVAYGDMLRVPVNVPKDEARSLEQARALGADIRPIASPLEAARIAHDNPARQVVFLAAGFETTTAPLAALLQEGAPENLLLVMAGRLTWPAVAMLLDSEQPGFDALIAPGHVSAVMGSDEWLFVPEKHGLPAAVAGFSPESLLAAFYAVIRQKLDGKAGLANCYPEVVRPQGNVAARRLLAASFDIGAAPWRGIGNIPASGYHLKGALRRHDAREHLPDHGAALRRRAGEMPPGCDCARVVLGRIPPTACKLYGQPCTPRSPIGPCMVSDEGACRIWWSAGTGSAS
ncbi:hydrogenase formation protein HypD [Sulfurivermis fontis]|uniref:hydrogenase formation protein HypD n=1 Tax=Sulfurivermis fontis TaxID=1972068 RepID=UPI000FDBC7DE|nr:hydrogenase formation protein HypD [Sulfurivermis fontis]